MRLTTKTGCTVRTVPLEVGWPHLGEGVMLLGRMEQRGDGRMFEVAFTTEEWKALIEGPLGDDDD